MLFLDILKEHAERFPDRCAVCLNHHEQAMTYQTLWERSGKVYAWLKKYNIGREDMVLLHMPRDPRVYACTLGVMRAGAAFTVVENTSPEERTEFVRKDSEAKIVLTETVYEEILQGTALDGYEDRDSHDAAFAVYTSGTTGTPKGVLHEYGVIDLEIRYHQTLAKETGERFASILPIGFVAYIMEFTQQLTYGNTVFILDYDIAKNLNRFCEFLETEQIESIHLPPSMFRRIQNIPNSVRKVKVGTEPANGLFMDNVSITNNYAQSETFFTIANMILDRKYDKAPVGKNPIGVELKILDDDGNETAKNTVGEICFHNEFFRGYIHLKEQTEYAFRNGIYHTGDLGYINEDGNLVISGRKDDMIKINGNRIEPAEIEAAGRRILGVDQTVAKGFIEDNGRSYVALYYVRKEGTEKLSEEDKTECIRKIAQILPKYMVPAYLIEIDKIPTVPNGKTDRKALPKPDTRNYRTEYEAPKNEFESRLCKVIGEVLGIERVGRQDDFYSLGGDSLTGIEVITRMDLPAFSTTDLFRGRTVSKISELYHQKQEEDTDWETGNEEAKKKEYPLTFEMKRFWKLQSSRPGSFMSIRWQMIGFLLENIDTKRFRQALNTVIHSYSIFGTVITLNELNELVQKYDPASMREAAWYEVHEADMIQFLQSKEKGFRMLGEPFFDLSLIRTETHLYLLIRYHHIVFDGTCSQLLAEAVANAYEGKTLRPDTYYLYLDQLQRRQTAEYEAELNRYFRSTFLQKDYLRYPEPDRKTKPPLQKSLLKQPYPFSTDDLKNAAKELGGTPGVLAFASVLLAFASCCGKKDVIGLMQYNNRDDLLSTNTLGLLARSLPVAVEFEKLNTVQDFVENLKYKITQGMAFDCTEKLIGKDTPDGPECLTCAYQGVLTGIGELARLGGEPVFLPPSKEASRDLAVLFVEQGEEFMSVTVYREQYYSMDMIRRFHDAYTDILCTLVSNKNSGCLPIQQFFEEKSYAMD